MTELLTAEEKRFRENSIIISNNLKTDRDAWKKKYEDCDASSEKLTDMLGEFKATIEAQQAQIQKLTHERDAYRLTLTEGKWPAHSPEYNRQLDAKIFELQEQNEAQQAQIKGLVEALKYYSVTTGWRDDNGESARKTLSTIPAAFLEREKTREAVIDRFREAVNTAAVTAESIRLLADGGEIELTDWEKFLPVVEALEDLEGGE